MAISHISIALAVLLGLLLLTPSTYALTFYIPSFEPVSYQENMPVEIRVNSVRSLSEIFPYDYYKLPFCKPTQILYKPEVLGEVIWGDLVQSSDYSVPMKKNTQCMVLPCGNQNDYNKFVQKKENIDMLEEFINKGYRGYMSIDNLPTFNNGTQVFGGNCKGQVPVDQTYPFLRGYALGVHKNCLGTTLINNHLEFVIEYHEVPDTSPRQYRVVGFTATPFSVKHQDDAGDCKENTLFNPRDASIMPLTTNDVRDGKPLHWTYGVRWVSQPNIAWGSRWDAYLRTSQADSSDIYHWVYIVCSLVITLSISSGASVILLRTLHRDFNRYNAPVIDENQEEVGWKLVHADVFRPPQDAALLSALTGSGVQLLLMFVGVLILAVLGFLSPSARGYLLTSIILLFVIMSLAAGFTCGKLLKYYDVQAWKHVFMCGMLFPGMVCGIYFISDIMNAAHQSSDSVPFLTLLLLFTLWLVFSVPLTVLGASFAFHQTPLINPCTIGKLAREIPEQPWWLQRWAMVFIGPVFPLIAMYMELRFILSAIWQGMVYYVFGFLAIAFVVWIVTVVVVSMIGIYYMLCYENHRWWWRAFVTPGGFGLQMFLYAMYFFVTQLNITSAASTTLYFLYMGLLSVSYGIATGAIAILTGIFFTRKIYGSIKVD